MACAQHVQGAPSARVQILEHVASRELNSETWLWPPGKHPQTNKLILFQSRVFGSFPVFQCMMMLRGCPGSIAFRLNWWGSCSGNCAVLVALGNDWNTNAVETSLI
jgi:hypothetical protein